MKAVQGATRVFGATASVRRAGQRSFRGALVLAAALVLAGCAGDSPTSFLEPRVPDVPKVDPAAYLSVGTPDVKRRATLTPADQSKLQRDLETLSKDNGRSLEQAIQKGT